MSNPFDSYTFGRIPQLDERNDLFRINAVFPADRKSPRSFTWPLTIPVLDQGRWSGCVGWSTAAELASVPDVVPGVDDAYGLHTYLDIQDDDEWAGSERAGDSPRMLGTSVLAAARWAKKIGYWPSYRWAKTLDELIEAVGRHGPVVVGADWTSRCMDTDTLGFVDPTRGDVVGGHAVLLRGHSTRRHAFRLRNSWSASWGEGGEAWVGYDGIEKWLSDGADMVLPERRKR